MSFCEGSSKATAIITYKGKTIRVESRKPPVDYTVEFSESDPQSGENVKCEYKLTNFNPDGSSGVEIFKLDPKKNIYVQTPSQGGTDFGFPAFVLWEGENRISAKYDGVQVVNMTVSFGGSCGGRGWRLKINDASGEIFNKFYPGEEQPLVDIACDDKCPQGQMKCKCSKYPGYCCIPCGEVVPKIKNLAQRMRGINV